MSLQKLIGYLYANPINATVEGQSFPVYPWLLLRDIMLAADFKSVEDEELITLIDLAAEKGLVQVDWKTPLSFSAIRLLEPGFHFAKVESRPRIGF